MKAMILAAGNGTRLKPLTDYKPKALVQIHGIPLLELIIKRLIKFGFTDLIINVHHFADQILDFLTFNNHFGINIAISDETGLLLETGGGIVNAKWFLNDNEPFMVYNVDILSDINLSQLVDYHIKNGALATLAVKERNTSRQILFDEKYNLCEWRNVQTGERKISRTPCGELKPLAFSGIHVLNPVIFDLIEEKGVFSIMDVYLRLAKNYEIKGFDHSNTSWYDMGRYEHVVDFNNSGSLEFLNK
ncbi:MAG: nucleotidyltransferase family protein [Bacteroidales bacterium]